MDYIRLSWKVLNCLLTPDFQNDLAFRVTICKQFKRFRSILQGHHGLHHWLDYTFLPQLDNLLKLLSVRPMRLS